MDCDSCLYRNVVEGLSEGFSRIDAIHAITNHIADKIAGYGIYDRDNASQAACVAVDTIIRAVDRAKEESQIPVGNDEDETGPLPLTLQIIKERWDQEADNSACKPDPDYDLVKHIKELGLAKEPPEDILVIDCPLCGRPSYYDGGFTDTCSCCGYYNLADHSDEAYTLADYYQRLAECDNLP